jgi:hypothetical protein
LFTPAEAANQVSDAEGNGGSRIWAFPYGCAKEFFSPDGAFVNGLQGIRRRLLHLPVDPEVGSLPVSSPAVPRDSMILPH